MLLGAGSGSGVKSEIFKSSHFGSVFCIVYILMDLYLKDKYDVELVIENMD